MAKLGGLMLHCGGEPASFEELEAVPLPKQTDTYMPVSHAALVKKVIEITTDVLQIKLEKTGYGLASNGNHMFGHLRFMSGRGNKDMGLCIGVANSYDRHLRVRIAAGASVFVCDNLMITSDITYTRKHTSRVWEDIEDAIFRNIGGAEAVFDQLVIDAERMKQTEVSDDAAYQVMGLLYGWKILGNQMLTVARKQWDTPDHKAFEERNQWSLYNALNSALKLARPGDIMEKHRELHRLLGSPNVRFDPRMLLPN